MKDHPDIVVEPVEWEWNAETFATQLAGDTLPTTFRVPFTDTKGLAERQQIADVTEYVEALPYADEFNPSVLAAAQGTDGKIYGLPTDVYGVGLHYNRDAVRGGRPRPGLAADHVGRGARGRQGDRRRDRPGRLRPDERQQHRRLDAHHADLRARRPDASPRTAPTATVDNDATARGPADAARHAVERRVDGQEHQLRVGHRSTRRSPPARSACTCPARTSTTRWCTTNQVDPDAYGLAVLPLARQRRRRHPRRRLGRRGQRQGVSARSRRPR